MIYMNEIDPYCAQWLQNLMDAGVLPAGHIDTRSIEDVTPNDLAGYTQCHFFAGLGGWIYALDLAGWPRDRPVWTGSCPCQPFSSAGKGAGFADERHLWPAWQHLIAQCRPPVVFGEQVASKDADPWIDLVHADMEGMGYAFGCVPFPSAGVGAPHIRDRNYWVADANNSGRIGWWPSQAGDGRDSTRQQSERFCDAGGMADANGGNARAEREQRSGQQRQQQANGGVGRVAYTDRWEQQGVTVLRGNERNGPDAGWPQGGRGAAACGEHGRMGNPADESRERDARGVLGAEAPKHGARLAVDGCLPFGLEHASAGVGPHAASPLHGFWRDADWLGCTDGKWRPVEPGTFPLAHGIPGRVGRLRAYGNAINPHQAAEFVAAFMNADVRQSLAAA